MKRKIRKNPKLIDRTSFQNCSVCVHRSECWGSTRYGDSGALNAGMIPYPSSGVCLRFRYDFTK